MASILIYYFSDDSKARVLACEGNYYYTDQEIYSLADVSLETRMWLTPSILIEKKLKDNPMIESVSIKKTNGKITFEIHEKLGIGYYIENGKTYILTIDNESIQVEDNCQSCIEHLPYMSGLSAKQRKQFASVFKEAKESEEKKAESDRVLRIDKAVFEKISEITPFQKSFDDNMIKMVMVDGNSVYSEMNDVAMIARYQLALTFLQGKSACLVLYKDEQTIGKVNCDDITTTKERQTVIEELDQEEEEEKKKKDDEEEEDYDPDDIDSMPDDKKAAALDKVQDWEPDYSFGLDLEYSPSTGYYRNSYTYEYYGWDDATGSFVPVYR
ncbi:MAG: hypothetical protein HUJ53_10205 [Holdemanella sp.]|nr:hypothetical protein [Holdemanella sp.]